MTTTQNNRRPSPCSFCNKPATPADILIATHSPAAVCYDCIRLLAQVIDEQTQTPQPGAPPAPKPTPTPREIYANLNDHVIGQEKAKKILSVAVYNHYKRTRPNHTPPIEIQKANILLIGPTGSGKTLLAQTLAQTLDVPLAICDATSLTESGYVGEDVETILLRLIQAADWDLPRAQQGIIYIDEIDKIARKPTPNPSITRDVSGEGVQQELLKIIEGCTANIPPQGGRKHPRQELLQLDTRNILFICGGAFDGLTQITQTRANAQTPRLGFLANTRTPSNTPTPAPNPRTPADTPTPGGAPSTNNRTPANTPTPNAPPTEVTPDDLLEYGFIPEMVGRLPITVTLHPLDQQALIQILTQPKNAIIKQYQHLFRMDGVELEFTPQALQAAADRALQHTTGARSLRHIIETTLLDVMYDLPSLPKATRCLVDTPSIQGTRPPTLYTPTGHPLPLPTTP